MKTNRTSILVGLLAVLCLLFAPVFLFAQEAVPVVPVLPADAQNFILDLLGRLMVSHPWVATLVAVLGSMRLWAKPLFSLIHTIVDATPSKTDDGLWATAYAFFTVNPVGKFIAYALDWFASVKITPPAKPADPAP